MNQKKYGLDVVSLNDESGVPFGMREGVIITSTHPVMEATIFKMVIKNNIYCTDEHFSIYNDAILRHSSCGEDLIDFLTTLAIQYFDIPYEEIAITDDLVRCCEILDKNNLYERKDINKSLNKKRKIIDFTKK